MSNKAKSTAVSPITGEATTITTNNVQAPASMKASGSTLDSIKACARQEFGILLKAESDRASIWRTVLTDHVRVKQDWEAYLREFACAIADHFKAVDKAANPDPNYEPFDFTKGRKTWPEWAQREHEMRFQNQEAQIKRILVAIEKEGLDKVRKIMSGALIRLTDGTYQERQDKTPLGLQEVIKNLPRDSRGRKAKAPTVPQKATVAAAVEGMAPAEFATPAEGKASNAGKDGLAVLPVPCATR